MSHAVLPTSGLPPDASSGICSSFPRGQEESTEEGPSASPAAPTEPGVTVVLCTVPSQASDSAS